MKLMKPPATTFGEIVEGGQRRFDGQMTISEITIHAPVLSLEEQTWDKIANGNSYYELTVGEKIEALIIDGFAMYGLLPVSFDANTDEFICHVDQYYNI